ncbi:MAG: protein-L-isoaspartate(D-aspartate) O-methyltransferase [Alphaproteobacteria bacterium]
MNEELFTASRHQMVHEIALYVKYTSAQIGKEALDGRILKVMSNVPRHVFVPLELQSFAYVDTPLPIGYGKTISQPYMVALMTDLLALKRDDTVLEIGTGLGYQAAILAELAMQVYSIEIIEELEEGARKRLKQHGYTNVETKVGDGYHGWPKNAPFDAIIVTAAPDLVPPALINQLKAGGRMVVPAGVSLDSQQLMLVEKDPNGRITTKEILPVRFTEFITDTSPTLQ